MIHVAAEEEENREKHLSIVHVRLFVALHVNAHERFNVTPGDV